MRCKRCAHGLCNSDSRYADKSYMYGVTFYPFPSAIKEPHKRLQWVLACNRLDFDINRANTASYICSKHFIDSGGPSEKNPNPVLATGSDGSCRTRRKLGTAHKNNSFTVINQPTASHQDMIADNSTSFHDGNENCAEKMEKCADSRLVDQCSTYNDAPLMSLKFEDVQMTESSVTHDNSECQVSSDIIYGKGSSQDTSTSDTFLAIKTETISETIFFQEQSVLQAEEVMLENPSHLTPFILYKKLVLFEVPEGWTPFFSKDELHFLKIQNNYSVVTLKIDINLQCYLYVYGKELSSSHPLKERFPQQIASLVDVYNNLLLINQWKVCQGITNTELSFTNMVLEFSKIKDCQPFHETCSLHGKMCMRMLPMRESRDICTACRFLKYRLKAAVRRKESRSKKVQFGKKCNFRYLSVTEMQKRMKKTQQKLKCSTRKIIRLRRRIENIIAREEKDVDEEDNQMFDGLLS